MQGVGRRGWHAWWRVNRMAFGGYMLRWRDWRHLYVDCPDNEHFCRDYVDFMSIQAVLFTDELQTWRQQTAKMVAYQARVLDD